MLQIDYDDSIDYMDSIMAEDITEATYPNIPDRPHSDYDPKLYIKAQTFTSQMWQDLSNEKKKAFSEYARQLHSILRQVLLYCPWKEQVTKAGQ